MNCMAQTNDTRYNLVPKRQGWRISEWYIRNVWYYITHLCKFQYSQCVRYYYYIVEIRTLYWYTFLLCETIILRRKSHLVTETIKGFFSEYLGGEGTKFWYSKLHFLNFIVKQPKESSKFWWTCPGMIKSQILCTYRGIGIGVSSFWNPSR